MGRLFDPRRPLVVALLVLLPLGLLPGGTFVSDDWFVLARDARITAADWPAVFGSLFSGWYRPLFDLTIHVMWRLFGLTAWPYQWVSLAGMAVCAWLTGKLCARLIDTPGASWQGALVFSCLAVHAETAFWLAALNDVLAGLVILVAACALVDYLESPSASRLLLIAAASIAAIMSKETGIAVLPVLAACCLPYLLKQRSRGLIRVLQAAAAPMAAVAIYLPWRLAAGMPDYAGASHPAGLLKNLIYTQLMIFVGWPASMHSFSPPTAMSLRIASIATTFVSAIVLALLIVRVIRRRITSRHDVWTRNVLMRGYGDPLPPSSTFTALMVGVLWSIAALAPSLAIVTERTAFIASAGAALAVAALWTLAAEADKKEDGTRRRLKWSTVLLVAFCLAQYGSLGARGLSWHQARLQSAATLDHLERALDNIPAGTSVCLSGLRDSIESAYLFRNAFPSAGTVLGLKQRIIGVTDVEVKAGLPAACQEAEIRLDAGSSLGPK